MGTLDIAFKKYKYLYLYYIILLIICVSWTNTDMIAPPMFLRILVTGAIFIPLIKYIWLLPSIIILFVSIRFNSIAPFGYIPQDWSTYSYITILILIIHYSLYKKGHIACPSIKQISLLLFLLVVDSLNLKSFSDYFFFILLLFILYNLLETEISLHTCLWAFMLTSLILSIYFFMYGQQFMATYNYSDLGRSYWVDPNYFSALIGTGNIIAFKYLFFTRNNHLNFFCKVILFICIITSFITIVMQASRGALLALCISIIIMLFLSNVKVIYKLVIIGLLTAGIIALFEQGTFALLEYRIHEDTEGGSGRLTIWNLKLDAFYSSVNNWAGLGYGASHQLSIISDCHNEYISILINYGIIGAGVLFYYLWHLLKAGIKDPFLLSSLFYVIITFMLLSPLTSPTGWPFALYLIILEKLSNVKKVSCISS